MSPFISGLRTFDRLLARLAGAVSAISGFCLVLLVACFGWLVFGRYVLNATPTWVEQVALLLIVVITFFSTASNRSEEHTSELQSLMRTSSAVFCLQKKKNKLL